MLYESLKSYPGVAHLNDLLRQQSENVFWTSKNRHFLQFWAVFLDFLIFSILDGFVMVSLSNSVRRRNFLPGNGSRSLRGWNFTQNQNFIKDVIGRNKKYQKYQLWAPDEFIIPPSPRALALHALIISLKPSAKIIKLQNECTEFSHNEEFSSKISNLSFNFDLKTVSRR